MRPFATLIAMSITAAFNPGGGAVAAGPPPALQEHSVAAPGDALSCDLSEYTTGRGPRAALEGNALLVSWRGDASTDLRLRLGLDDAQPVVRELAVRPYGGEWGTLGRNLRPDFHVTSGVRRVSYQQLNPLREPGVEIAAGPPGRDSTSRQNSLPLRLRPVVPNRPGAGRRPPSARATLNA